VLKYAILEMGKHGTKVFMEESRNLTSNNFRGVQRKKIFKDTWCKHFDTKISDKIKQPLDIFKMSL